VNAKMVHTLAECSWRKEAGTRHGFGLGDSSNLLERMVPDGEPNTIRSVRLVKETGSCHMYQALAGHDL